MSAGQGEGRSVGVPSAAAAVAPVPMPRDPEPTEESLRTLEAAGLPVEDAWLGEMPSFSSLNPTIVSRSGLVSQPFRLPRGGWSMNVAMSYANVVEYSVEGPSLHVLDAEIARGELKVGRDLGRNFWVTGSAGMLYAHQGVFDPFLDWYHEAIGFVMKEREIRPNNSFADSLVIDNQVMRASSRGGWALSDIRLTGGVRMTPWAQAALSVTLPVAGQGNLDYRGVPSVSVTQTVRGRLGDRGVVELAAGLGYAPKQARGSVLEERSWSHMLSAGSRVRVVRGHALYGVLFVHSPSHAGTGMDTLDGGELTVDFGYVHRWRSGRELRIGFTEDIHRTDQGVDFGVRVSILR